MDRTMLFALGLFAIAAALLLGAATIGFFLWRVRRQTARHRSMASTF